MQLSVSFVNKFLFCCLVFQIHIRNGELVNGEGKARGKADVSSKLQEEPEEPTEQPSEDIILQINPASTKDEKKLNKDVNEAAESNESVSYIRDEQEPLPDKPLQLVQPDPHLHKRLILVEENVKHLHFIEGAVAVVVVVGKFHSGKSFLLNQLMGKQKGFGIGPSVKPQTMGIWMWGKPMEVTKSSGENLSVIFLDTEGFAANNISESYDAKIFAVSTLLSSYLIYNSVKIIDQGDIDYLELLARRTQLFALRSQVSHTKRIEEFNHDLLKFPPLMWVVQDFVQATVEADSPREWLLSLMDTSSRESEYDINLLGMFESVNCHTLFLPATKKLLLQDLSMATEEDLTDEYRVERDKLLAELRDDIKPKEKNGKAISGPQLASLLEILVMAANEGSLAEIPGRWETLVTQLRQRAEEDCVLFYEAEVSAIHRLHQYGPINPAELEGWHEQSWKKAVSLLKQLLFGLDDAIRAALEVIDKATEEQYERTRDVNEKKIQLKCADVQRRAELMAEEELEKIVLPIKSTSFRDTQRDVKRQCVTFFERQLINLQEHTIYQRHLDHLENGLENICDTFTLRNNDALEQILVKAIELSIAKFKEGMKNNNNIPRTVDQFEHITEGSTESALKVFNTESDMANDEKLYAPYLALFKNRLEEELQHSREDNNQLITSHCETQVITLVDQFRSATGPSKIALPTNDSDLEEKLDTEEEMIMKTYDETQKEFSNTDAFYNVRTKLERKIEEVRVKRREQNMEAYSKEVEVPLSTAKKLINLSAENYNTEFSLRQYMITVCLLNLDDGKAKHWSPKLKYSIVSHFVNTDMDLQRLLASRRGLWSSILGFWQWIIWLINGGLST